MIVDRQLVKNFQESVEQLEMNIRFYSSQFIDQPSTLRVYFRESILNKFADIHFFLGKLIARVSDEEKNIVFGFSISEPEQTSFNTSDNSMKPEFETQATSSCWSANDMLTDVVSENYGCRLVEPRFNLKKRAPSLLLVASPDETSLLDEYKFESEEKHFDEQEKTPTTPRRRGRIVSSIELENYLLESIKAEWKGSREPPSRKWITRLARNFIEEHRLELRCSKGWLDKFIRRNQHML